MNTTPINAINKKKYTTYTLMFFDFNGNNYILYSVKVTFVSSNLIFSFNQN